MMRILATLVLSSLLLVNTALAKFDVSKVDKKENGTFSIYLKEGSTWNKISQAAFSKFFETKTLDIKANSKENISLRIVKSGGGHGHMDYIALNGKAPISSNTKTYKFKKIDNDVVDTTHETILNFDIKKADKLILNARIEPEVIGKTPFHYPVSNTFRTINNSSEFYSYKLNSNKKSLTIDGLVDKNKHDKPLFNDYFPVGSGHPQGSTYGWVMNDEENLYVAIDFTADNTVDGPVDYTKVFLKTKSGIKEYKITQDFNKWGKVGFTYTDKVNYEHKYYEFAIPMSELDPEADTIQMAFAAYGTAATEKWYQSRSAYDSNNNRHLHLASYYTGSQLIHRIDILDNNLNTLTSNIIINPNVGNTYEDTRYTNVVYNPQDNVYLVTFEELEDPGPSMNITISLALTRRGLYGKFINPDGSISGNAFTIQESVELSDHTLSYNPDKNEYFLTWREYSEGSWNIFGKILKGDGTTQIDSFAICNTSLDQYGNNIVYNSTNKEYISVWSNAYNDNELYYQIIGNDGSIADTTGNLLLHEDKNLYAEDTCIAYDNINNRFLVVTDYDSATGSLIGKLFSADGTSLTPTFNIGNIQSSYRGKVDVSFNESTQKYTIAWRLGSALHTQKVNSDGSKDGADVETDNSVPYGLSLLYNSLLNNDVLFYNNNSTKNVVLLSSNAIDSSLVTFPYDAPLGISENAGTTVNFKVTYFGTSAPSKAELHIDRNRDMAFKSVTQASLPKAGASAALLLIGVMGSIKLRKHKDKITMLVMVLCLASSGVLLTSCGTTSSDDPILSQITAVSPANGATGVSINTTIEVTFAQEMNKSTVESAITLYGLSQYVTGNVTWNSNTIIYTPSANLQNGTTYQIGLSSDAKDSNGKSLTAVSYSFTTSSERYIMTEVDPSDTDYTDGKEYEIAISLPAGTYDYKFVFEDAGSSPVTGLPSQENSVTVN